MWYIITLNVETESSTGTFVSIYQIEWRAIPGNRYFQCAVSFKNRYYECFNFIYRQYTM
jgi:hypothetical protein